MKKSHKFRRSKNTYGMSESDTILCFFLFCCDNCTIMILTTVISDVLKRCTICAGVKLGWPQHTQFLAGQNSRKVDLTLSCCAGFHSWKVGGKRKSLISFHRNSSSFRIFGCFNISCSRFST